MRRVLFFVCALLAISSIAQVATMTKLACYNRGLTRLDLSRYVALEDLNCERNRLTKLDLSSCTNLQELTCSYNQIRNLDVSGTRVSELFCDRNALTNLVLPPKETLTRLYCEENQLTSLDLDGYTNLTELLCHDNMLTNLNLAGVKLVKLRCDNNQLTGTLDVSLSDELWYVDARSNRLTAIKVSARHKPENVFCDPGVRVYQE